MDSTKLAVGDRIRVQDCLTFGDCEDFTIEEFRQCLGIFANNAHREAGRFTTLCELYTTGPNSEEKYIGNYGTYYTNEVPVWMNIPKDAKKPTVK